MGKDGPIWFVGASWHAWQPAQAQPDAVAAEPVTFDADAIARMKADGQRLDAARWAANEKAWLERHRLSKRGPITQEDRDLAYWWAVGNEHDCPTRAKWMKKWKKWVNLMTCAFHPATDKAEAFNAASRARALYLDPELNWKGIQGPFHATVKDVVPRPMLRRLAIQLGREIGDIPRKLHGVPLRDVGRRHRRPHGLLHDND